MKFDVLNRWSGEVQFTAKIKAKKDDGSSYKMGLAIRWAIKNDANLRNANLWNADLRNADLRSANLGNANLWNADLGNAIKSLSDLPQLVVYPTEGVFTAWKSISNGHIAKLTVPARAKRTGCLQSRKCRAEYVKVLAIYDRDGKSVGDKKIESGRGGRFFYQKGKTVKPDSYNDNFREECTNGIHFFITRKEAEDWS